MFFTTSGFALAALVLLALRRQASHRSKEFGLGWMSDRWLTEQRRGQSSPVV